MRLWTNTQNSSKITHAIYSLSLWICIYELQLNLIVINAIINQHANLIQSPYAIFNEGLNIVIYLSTQRISISCDHYEYESTRKDNLKQHIQAVKEPFKFICNQCDYEPTHKTRLKLHMQSKHDHCEYASTMQINLVVTMRLLTNMHISLNSPYPIYHKGFNIVINLSTQRI